MITLDNLHDLCLLELILRKKKGQHGLRLILHECLLKLQRVPIGDMGANGRKGSGVVLLLLKLPSSHVDEILGSETVVLTKCYFFLLILFLHLRYL